MGSIRSIAFKDGKRLVLEQTREEWEAENGPLPPIPEMVSDERDRRRDAGFMFGGNLYDSDQKSLLNIAGAGSMAGFAVMGGAIEGDMRWHGGESDFAWITAGNVTIEMDAHTMLAMSKAALLHISGVSLAARSVKDLVEIPADYKEDKYWGISDG